MQPELLCPRRSRFAPKYKLRLQLKADRFPVKSSRGGPLCGISRGRHSSTLRWVDKGLCERAIVPLR
ncbi:hypothetical protein D1BOALGB6SA_8621 [Olavius sp. associated proteobacterium Delta 1]|nr:hypothetical protein D1BOALGB6SA_8621 [Olavius sp. associated proteobacterium Delta 1]